MTPRVTGKALQSEVARLPPGLGRRFIFMTGGAFGEQKEQFLADTSNRRLSGPFSIDVLEQACRRSLLGLTKARRGCSLYPLARTLAGPAAECARE